MNSNYGGYGTNFYSNNNSVSENMASPMAKKSNDQTLRPLTIKQVIDAKETIPDNPCVLDGKPINNVMIVARVNSVNEQSTVVKYMLDDGTGMIEASKWVDNKDSTDEPLSVSPFNTGSYVRVIGSFRIFHSKKSIQASHIIPVKSIDEITYHLLSCIYTHLYLTRGPPRSNSGNMSMNQNNMNISHAQPIYSSNALPAQDSRYSQLEGQVLKAIRDLDNGTNMDGVSFKDVAFKFRGIASELDVRGCVDTLMNDSVIYTTCDDDSFKMS